MCDYLSAIGLLGGDVYHQDGIDRHSELIKGLAPKLNVGAQQLTENSFELEFKPVQGLHLGRIDHYCLNIDRFNVPCNYDTTLKWAIRQDKLNDMMIVWSDKLVEVARSKIIKTGHIEILPPGDWVLCGDVIVESVTERSRVIALLDDAQIRDYARNAEITVYDKNSFPGVPLDYRACQGDDALHYRFGRLLRAGAHCSGADAKTAQKDAEYFAEPFSGKTFWRILQFRPGGSP